MGKHTTLRFSPHAHIVTDLTREALKEHVDAVFQRSQEEVPVATGALKASGRVEETSEGFAIVYDAPYARAVHFDPEPGGQRFLSDPAYAAVGRLNRDVSDAVNQALRAKLPKL